MIDLFKFYQHKTCVSTRSETSSCHFVTEDDGKPVISRVSGSMCLDVEIESFSGMSP
jgi:hypothetical protein